MATDQVKKCANCQRELSMGLDVLSLQQGVVGPRGFVPLEEMTLLCNKECVRQYFSDDPWGSVQRIP